MKTPLPIETSFSFASWIAVDDWFHAAGATGIDDPVGVVTGVRDERAATRVRDQLFRHHRVVKLTWSQRDVDRPPLRVDEGMEFGRKTYKH